MDEIKLSEDVSEVVEESAEIIAEEPYEEEKPSQAIFEINGEPWELKYTEGRIDLIERTTQKSVVGIAIRLSQGFYTPTLEEIRILFGCGLKKIGGGYIHVEKGKDIASRFIREIGYPRLMQHVVVALQRDLPFLFQAD